MRENSDKNAKKGGTRRVDGDVWADPTKHCRHPEHKPAGHIVRQPGTYEHTCPGCGWVTAFHVPFVTW